QKEALDFIESLPYIDITTVGHSKGGNKSMYVRITSDKVKRSVSLDGQGFSQEFIGKYWAEIQMKGNGITNYSLSTDYVNILMFPVPNSKQIHTKGYGVGSIAEHHSPNSFFVTDEFGNLELDVDGKPQIVEIEQDESLKMLHDFTTFLINKGDRRDKKLIEEYLSELLAFIFAGDPSEKELIDFALADEESIVLIISYLAKFMDEYNYDAEDIDKLIGTLIPKTSDESEVSLNKFIKFGVNKVLSNINDNDYDVFITSILLLADQSKFLKELNINSSKIWTKVNAKVKTIKTSGGTDNGSAKVGEIRDFSQNIYSTLISTIDKIEHIGSSPVSTWSRYSSEEWYSSLSTGLMIKGISLFYDKLAEINRKCKSDIENIFEAVIRIDSNYAGRIKNHNEHLKLIKSNLEDCALGK
ncbi:MAG: hypothetical protein ACI33I_13945, partial [Clostridium sp.]